MEAVAPGGTRLRLSSDGAGVAAIEFAGLLTYESLVFSRDWAISETGGRATAWVLDFRKALIAMSANQMNSIVSDDQAVSAPGAIVCTASQMDILTAHRGAMARKGVIRAAFLTNGEAWRWIRWVLAALPMAVGPEFL